MNEGPKSAGSQFASCIALLAMAFMVVLITFINFSHFEGASNFGLTPHFVKLAQDVEEHGKYVRNLDGLIIDEVLREPLYPLALLLCKRFFGSYQSLVYVQLVVLVLVYYMWGQLALSLFGWLRTIFFFSLLIIDPTLAFYSSILYPYVFQLFLLTGMIFFLHKGFCEGHIGWFGLAGVFVGLASYERGAYLLLPAFLACGLFFFRKRFNYGVRHLLTFAAAAYLLVAPWLVRNMSLGTFGMNEASGFTLGWTYGQLKSPQPLTKDEQRYDEYVSKTNSDTGSWGFICDEVRSGRSSTFAEAHRKVVSIVLRKMKNNIGSVAYIVMVKNFGIFPGRLCDLRNIHIFSHESRHDIGEFWQEYIEMRIPSACDFILFFGALLGILIIWRKRTGFALILILVFSYTFIFSTTFVISDPRYRGIVDIFLILLAACTLVSGLTWMYSGTKRCRCKLGS